MQSAPACRPKEVVPVPYMYLGIGNNLLEGLKKWLFPRPEQLAPLKTRMAQGFWEVVPKCLIHTWNSGTGSEEAFLGF